MSDITKDDPRAPIRGKRWGKGLTVLASLGWVVAALLVAERMHATNLNSSLHSALVRSQTERHELSKELQRRSHELDALENRLARYENRETQAAVNP